MSEDIKMDIEQVIAHLTCAVIELHDRTTLRRKPHRYYSQF